MDREEVLQLARRLRALFPQGPQVKEDAKGWDSPAVNVFNCVLSLRVNYERDCRPMVEGFIRRYPDVFALQDLDRLIRSYPTPLDFCIQTMGRAYKNKAVSLPGVVTHLISIESRYPGATQPERMHAWALAAKPIECYDWPVMHFRLGGFQYLRKLFGAQTVKPDTHIIGFVSRTIGRNVDDWTALELIEAAGNGLGFPLGDMDYALWCLLSGKEEVT